MDFSRLQNSVLAFLFVGLASYALTASALPFNSDMVNSQLRTGSVMRPRVPGTVSVGSLASRIDSREEAEKLTNPTKADAASIAHGRRLFSANCAVCHSDISKSPWTPSVVFLKGMPGPDLTQNLYVQRTDGSIYGTIHLGSVSGLMPAYGWKFSPAEHWDIINYVRKVQSTKAGK